MSKKQLVILVIISVALSLLLNVFFGGQLAAKLSTFRLFNKFQILRPQAPIVINTKEEVRANDNEDILNAIDKVRSKLSLLVYVDGVNVKVVGAAVNATSDGYFLSASPALVLPKNTKLLVLLNSGQSLAVTQVLTDPVSNLVLLKTEGNGIPVVDFGKSQDLNPGQRIIFLRSSTQPYASNFSSSFITQKQADADGVVYSSDKPSQTFGVQSVQNLIPGQAVVDLDGQVVGMFDGSGVVASSNLKAAVNLFTQQKSNIQRPSYGFNYRIINPSLSGLLNLPVGAQVVRPQDKQPAVTPGSASGLVGLLENDVITAVNDIEINSDNLLEEILQRYKTGDNLKLSVSRAGAKIIINVVAGVIK